MNTRRLAIVLGISVSAGAHAYVIDTYPFWDNNITNGWFAIAQSFVVNPVDNKLNTYKFAIAGGSGSLNFSIVPWNINTGPTGAAVYSTVVGWPGVDGDVTLNGINTVLTANATYAAIVDLNGSSSQSVHWMANNSGNPTGHASWYNNGWAFLGGSG